MKDTTRNRHARAVSLVGSDNRHRLHSGYELYVSLPLVCTFPISDRALLSAGGVAIRYCREDRIFVTACY